jgi:hypothetical protein
LKDLVLHNSQEIYVTDTLAHHLYRFDRKGHTFTPMVDLRKKTTLEVNPGQHNTLAGIDGLYWYKGSLLGVQYGTGSFRVVRWRLSPDGRRVTSAQVLEHRTPLVSFPTTGAVTGGSA